MLIVRRLRALMCTRLQDKKGDKIMGYRSEVAYKSIGWKSRHEARRYIDKFIKKYDYSEINYMVENINIEETGEGIEIKYHEECIKWYENYKEIQFAEEVFYETPEHVAYCFLRVGEGVEDVEQNYSDGDGNNDDVPWLYVDRKINLDRF